MSTDEDTRLSERASRRNGDDEPDPFGPVEVSQPRPRASARVNGDDDVDDLAPAEDAPADDEQ